MRGAKRVQVLGAGAGCCQLAVRVVETGCRVLAVRVWCCERAGAGRWCWLCAWRTQGAGAGLLVLVVCVVEIGCWCRALALAVRVVETRHAVLRQLQCKNWSCCQCRVQSRKILCMLLLSGVYAGG